MSVSYRSGLWASYGLQQHAKLKRHGKATRIFCEGILSMQNIPTLELHAPRTSEEKDQDSHQVVCVYVLCYAWNLLCIYRCQDEVSQWITKMESCLIHQQSNELSFFWVVEEDVWAHKEAINYFIIQSRLIEGTHCLIGSNWIGLVCNEQSLPCPSDYH